MCTPYITVCKFSNFKLKIPDIHGMYVLFWPILDMCDAGQPHTATTHALCRVDAAAARLQQQQQQQQSSLMISLRSGRHKLRAV